MSSNIANLLVLDGIPIPEKSASGDKVMCIFSPSLLSLLISSRLRVFLFSVIFPFCLSLLFRPRHLGTLERCPGVPRLVLFVKVYPSIASG